MDSNGFLINVKVLPVNISDSLGAQILLSEISSFLVYFKIIFADSGYDKDKFKDYLLNFTDIALLIIKNLNTDIKGFVIKPWRWIVERTNSWIVKSRRLSLDYELLFDTSEGFIYVSMIRKMIRQLI